MKDSRPRVAYFPDAYLEMDGVGRTSREFEEFARRRDLPLLLVHGGSRDEVSSSGSVTRVQVRRSWLRFSLEHSHDYDLIFLRRLRKVRRLVREFRPDVVQITGPSDVGTLGALIAHSLGIPLAATWQTNLSQFARSRVAAAISFLPEAMTSKFLEAIEKLSQRVCLRFYEIPQLLFAPNPEITQMLEKATGRPCLLMGHAADTNIFSPEFRTRSGGPLRIGYAGRFSAEKNVAAFARLEQELLARGHRDFRIVMIGQGKQENWLRKNLQQAEFTGLLTGEELSRAFADLDIFAFFSETDTLGLVVLEALASGVPAVVMDRGGPRFSVRHGRSGYVARTFEEFVFFTETLLIQPELIAKMRVAARQHALGADWDGIFAEMYENYEQYLNAPPAVSQPVLNSATS